MTELNNVDKEYAKILSSILKDGEASGDRTGVGTKSIFGMQMKVSLEENILPALSLRKVAPRIAFEELMFMLNGETDTKLLEAKKINIWKGNTSREFLDNRGLNYLDVGDMGRMYGSQLRDFTGLTDYRNDKHSVSDPISFDQLEYMHNAILEKISNPNASVGRRIMATHYNPAEADQGVLFPCHIMTQFNVRGDYLDCLFWMRSSDVGYGLPYNLMYYGMFTHMMAKLTGLKAGNLIYQSGDCHIYKDQIEAGLVDYMLGNSEKQYTTPKFIINKEYNTLEDMLKLTWEDIEIQNYNPSPDFKNKPSMAI